MRRFIMCVFAILAGCSFGASRGRTTTTYTVDDGRRPVQRTTVTQTTSGASIGGSMPIVMVGGGGYGGAMNGPSCVLHPDRCAVIQTATLVQPMTIVSYGGGTPAAANNRTARGAAPGEYDGVHVSEFDALTERVNNAIPKLKGSTQLALRQSCFAILKDPSGIEDAAERDTIVAGCKKLLAKKPAAATPTTPDAPAAAGEEN